MKRHEYGVAVEWTGAGQDGTRTYSSYRRDHAIAVEGKPAIPGSSDPAFRGDAARWNPEELFVASLSACHMLWYLHLCAVNQVTVLEYRDAAIGIMEEAEGGFGFFVRVVLKPVVVIEAGSDRSKALALHHEAHSHCFLANSVTFPVEAEAEVVEAAERRQL